MRSHVSLGGQCVQIAPSIDATPDLYRLRMLHIPISIASHAAALKIIHWSQRRRLFRLTSSLASRSKLRRAWIAGDSAEWACMELQSIRASWWVSADHIIRNTITINTTDSQERGQKQAGAVIPKWRGRFVGLSVHRQRCSIFIVSWHSDNPQSMVTIGLATFLMRKTCWKHLQPTPFHYKMLSGVGVVVWHQLKSSW